MLLRLSLLSLFAALVAAELRQATVVLQGANVFGNATFVQETDHGPVKISGVVQGLAPGLHGFHVHEKGDISSCSATGAHFNPLKKNHGGPNDTDRHVGDLGNIEAAQNTVATIAMTDSVISLHGPNSILGRAIVIHSDPDDLGKGGFADSLTTGHAGTRVACGVIGIM